MAAVKLASLASKRISKCRSLACGQGQIAAHPAGQPLPPRGTGHRGDIDLAHPRHLPGRQVTADRRSPRTGPLRANATVQRALLVPIWNSATTNTGYHDPGGDYFTRLNPQSARSNAVRQLKPSATTSPWSSPLTKPLAAPTHVTSILSSGVPDLLMS